MTKELNEKKLNIGVISLGCDKNRVDTEIMLGDLAKHFNVVSEPIEAHILIINTCGFIESSKQESIDTILEMAKYKNEGNCKILIATGCLTQRYGKELGNLIPELDIILGTNNYKELYKLIMKNLEGSNAFVLNDYSDEVINIGERMLTTTKGTAYLRIAEGCSNFCTYCVIPKIRGKYRSRPIEDVISEAKALASKDVKEIILIAQDITRYGIDLYNEKSLCKLIRELSNIEGIEWIRLLYCYPEEIDYELINEIKNNPKICKYIDMPLQHISNSVLKRMNRRSTKEDVTSLIKTLREEIPDIVIRTSIIVGFPGETEEEFNELYEFIKEIKFDKMGVFKFSKEEGSAAAKMPMQINAKVKSEREKKLMLLQKEISKEINKRKVGRNYTVLVENFSDNIWSGRSYEMSPEIDGLIILNCDRIINIGDFVSAKIESSLEYDLIGVVCDEFSK